MREGVEVIGVVAADLHLSHNPPVARQETREEWYEAMRVMLESLVELANENACPLFLAGDIFHSPNAPAELINLALRHLKRVHHYVGAVPGQHDLFHHDLERIYDTPYYTLVEAGAVTMLGNLPKVLQVRDETIRVWGLSWGAPWEDLVRREKSETITNLLIAHHYIYCNDRTRHQGASDAFHMDGFPLEDFDIACFGDNHIEWSSSVGVKRKGTYCYVVNCGSTMRRNSDQQEHCPTAWKITRCEGRVGAIPHELDCTNDKLIDTKEGEVVLPDSEKLKEFLEALGKTVVMGSDLFEQSVMDYLSKARLSSNVRELVRSFMEKS